MNTSMTDTLIETQRRLAIYATLTMTVQDKLPVAFLVEATLAEQPGVAISLEKIVERLHARVGLLFMPDEVKACIDDLNRKGDNIFCVDGKYMIENQRADKIRRDNAAYELKEKAVFDKWSEGLSVKYPRLRSTDHIVLKDDLLRYVSLVLLRHAVETASALYSTTKLGELAAILRVADTKIMASLPERNQDVTEVRTNEYPMAFEFLGQFPDYFSSLISGAFFTFVLLTDKTCSQLVRKAFEGMTIYFDTNFMYGLIGLQGPKLQQSAEMIWSLAKELQSTMLITRRTIKEWQSSLEAAEKEFHEKYPDLPTFGQKLIRKAAEYIAETDETDFMAAAWRKISEGVKPHVFFSTYRPLQQLARGRGIRLDDDDAPELDNLIREDRNIAHNFSLEITTLKESAGKDDTNAPHDAFHYLLVSRLRQQEPYTYSEARVWFLTCDGGLARYYQHKAKAIPFCILASQWLQAVRCVIQRTEDFDRSFVNLVAAPYLRQRTTLSLGDIYTVTKTIGELEKAGVDAEDLLPTVIANARLQGCLGRDSISSSQERDTAIKNIALQELKKKLDMTHDEVRDLETRLAEEKSSKIEIAERLKKLESMALKDPDATEVAANKTMTASMGQFDTEETLKRSFRTVLSLVIAVFGIVVAYLLTRSFKPTAICVGAFLIVFILIHVWPLSKIRSRNMALITLAILLLLCGIVMLAWGYKALVPFLTAGAAFSGSYLGVVKFMEYLTGKTPPRDL